MVPLPCIFVCPVFWIANVIGNEGLVEGGALKRMKVSVIDEPVLRVGLVVFWIISRESAPTVVVNNLTVLVAREKVKIDPVGKVIRKVSLGPTVSVIENVKVSPPTKLLTPMTVLKDDFTLNDVMV